ncbi:hypothetical protein [Corynebacterium urealyticum]|uniref:hypothetical protein n=1 Tax=Corynebacterium urealyticum TaxID=43771 RepID=UPI0002B3F8C3|nr:hypothetical protein [Corynebacterium urealyticum]AGE35901.1 hypothetical protein CU7111_0305 [Corynebacterium urealyticum DSM 7111]QQB07609.1 hypothetical protein I6H53_00095 [Corynebacterium urealyticum]
MKRFPRTLTAAVMAGALAVGGATVAQAQDDQPAPGAAADYRKVGDKTYFKQADGTYKAEDGEVLQEDPEVDESDIPAPATKQDSEGTTWYLHKDGEIYVQDPANVNAEVTQELRDAYNEAFNPAPPAEDEVDESDIPAPATKQDSEGNTWYLHNNGEIYVKDKNDWNAEVTDELRNAYYEAFPDAKPDTPDNQGSSDFDKKKLAWLALPAALIIGGIVYHLMKDGQTYTPDEGRKNEDPTAEEKAASDKLLSENKDEVIAQGGQLAEGADAAATDRGIAAETGSNAAARGLAALAVVAMVAAGAFAASRKLFA